MIMPFGRKPTQAEAGRGPAEIDFNALWDHGYVPVIKELGYEAVRADQDTGALIIEQMLQRLYFADLVLADMTIPNGNVYYEVGIRHASKRTGCVLLAADWSEQLVRHQADAGDQVSASRRRLQRSDRQGFKDRIKDPIANLTNGPSPMHESIRGTRLTSDPKMLPACRTS